MTSDALIQHAEALAEWNELRAKARQIKDTKERAAALEALQAQRPVHPYFGGLSLTAIGRGTRRMLAPLRERHADARDQHAETLAAWKERRAKAREIKDPEERAKALEDLKGERPTHPVLVAAGCAVVGAVVLFGIPAVRHHASVIITGGLTLWVIAALIAGQTDPEADDQATDAPEDGAEADDDQAEGEPEPIGPTPAEAHRLVAALTAGGTSLLLTRLAADLAPVHPGWEPSTKTVRALLAGAGIAVRAGVRTPDGNGPGVHHQDVPPLPSPSDAAPATGVVANVGPGHSANANANNTEEWSTREGFVLRADPNNPARTIVVHSADAA